MKRFFAALAPALIFFALAAPASAVARTMTYGDSGSDVLTMQQTLATAGYLTATPTGYFGAATLAAVEKFQCDKKIVCTGDASYGVVGPHTQAALAGVGPVQPSTVNTADLTAAATGKFEIGGWLP